MKDQAAAERQRKVREWINTQRELQFTAKEAAHAIFTHPTQAEINYVSSVLSRHSKGDDACIHLIGKKHRNSRERSRREYPSDASASRGRHRREGRNL